jgi:hypothetical protein
VVPRYRQVEVDGTRPRRPYSRRCSRDSARRGAEHLLRLNPIDQLGVEGEVLRFANLAETYGLAGKAGASTYRARWSV